MKKRLRIPTPSAAGIEAAKTKWAANERFLVQEDSLRLLFQKLCPGHSVVSEVLLKVSVLNGFYNTNIYNTHAVAKRIVELNPAKRIAEGDLTVVNEIALVPVGGRQLNFYSFASKYCNQHHPNAFPIYDSLVEKMLLHFRNADGFAEFKRLELKQYPRFVEVIHEFRKHYQLERFSLRQIDRYLWFAGREAFKRAS